MHVCVCVDSEAGGDIETYHWTAESDGERRWCKLGWLSSLWKRPGERGGENGSEWGEEGINTLDLSSASICSVLQVPLWYSCCHGWRWNTFMKTRSKCSDYVNVPPVFMGKVNGFSELPWIWVCFACNNVMYCDNTPSCPSLLLKKRGNSNFPLILPVLDERLWWHVGQKCDFKMVSTMLLFSHGMPAPMGCKGFLVKVYWGVKMWYFPSSGF